MKMNVTFLFAAFSIVIISVNCQSFGQALSKDSATISGQFSDLKNAFDSGMSGMSSQVKDAVAAAQTQLQNVFSGTNTKEALTNLGTKVGEMSTQVKDAVSTAQNQLQNAAASGSNPQVANAKDALASLGTKVDEMSTQVKNAAANAGSTPQVTAVKDALTNVGTQISEAVKNIKPPKSFATTFWNNDVSTKFHTAAQKLLDFKDIDAKYTAPKTELATYMVNAQSTPNITDMINLARKHLSADEASKFFEQMASVAEQQKW
jgi:hypothetical protein